MANSTNFSHSPQSYQRKLRLAERHLRSLQDPLAEWIQTHGKCTLEIAWDRELFEALVRAIAHQQLHGKAAQSILNRLIGEFPRKTFPTPRQLARAAPERLRSLGFSNAKVVAIQGIANATLARQVPTRAEADTMSDDDLIARLVNLRGVGRWTVEMLLIFTLGRLDVMPIDDFGIRSGLQNLYGLSDIPKKATFAELTENWSPYRSIGAWYLWRYADAWKESRE